MVLVGGTHQVTVLAQVLTRGLPSRLYWITPWIVGLQRAFAILTLYVLWNMLAELGGGVSA